jgi:hypothetical protein
MRPMNLLLHSKVFYPSVGGDSQEAPLELKRYAHVGPFAEKLAIFGQRDASEVSRILSCCDLGLVEPPRSMICKSGGFVAMAANGLPVLTCGKGDPGYGLDELVECLTTERFLSEPPSRAELARWGEELRQVAGRKFGWRAIAASVLEMMRGSCQPTRELREVSMSAE